MTVKLELLPNCQVRDKLCATLKWHTPTWETFPNSTTLWAQSEHDVLATFLNAHLLDLLFETFLQVLVTPDQLVKNLLWWRKEWFVKRFVCLPAHLHLNIIKWIDDCRYFVKTITGLVFYLSICLHRLKVFLCREEAELGAGHVVRQSPAWGCRTGNKNTTSCVNNTDSLLPVHITFI